VITKITDKHNNIIKEEWNGWRKKKDKRRKGRRKLMKEEGLSCHLAKGDTPS